MITVAEQLAAPEIRMASNVLQMSYRSVTWLKKAHDESCLALHEPPHRMLTWNAVKKSRLIDSILRGYPVPEIYAQEKTDHLGNTQLVVVDGRQRIRACFEYIEDEFALTPDQSPWANAKFSDLSSERRKTIYTYNLTIRQIPEMEEADLRTIVSRLNLNDLSLGETGQFDSVPVEAAEPDFWSPAGLHHNFHGE
jgi:uncharacterized protein DUF262